MALKDFSLDLRPSQVDGLVPPMNAFGVVQKPWYTWQHYLEEPHLRHHIHPGCMNVWPKWICARLLSIALPLGMNEKEATQKVAGHIKSELMGIADRDLPHLVFHGNLESRGEEAWITSKPAAWIAKVRRDMRERAETLGFCVGALDEPDDQVRIIIRRPYKGAHQSGISNSYVFGRNDMKITFDKIGLRIRKRFGLGTSDPFGATLCINFGKSGCVTPSGPSEFKGLDVDEWPSLTLRTSPNDGNNRIVASDNETPQNRMILELHESTVLPLSSDVEVAQAASLREADLAARSVTASISWRISRNRSPYVVLLKVSRDPDEHHRKLGTCPELQQCREQLKNAGKQFQLSEGSYIFVSPDWYDCVLKAVELNEMRLFPQHLIVSQELEKLVRRVIGGLPCNSKTKCRSTSRIPLGLPSEALCTNITISHTFINVDVPSSIDLSASRNGAVASTSEVHNVPNPRRSKRSRANRNARR